MSELPAPLVAAETNLRDFAFMPLEIERLRRSKAWLLAKRSPELGFYMLNLWMASWHETPTASLEDDDDVLADAAMCDPRRWLKVRGQVLRGWVKCSDGRLYHPVVAEKAIEAWEAKEKQRSRGASGAAARWRKHTKIKAEELLADGKGQGQGQGEGEGEGEGESRDSSFSDENEQSARSDAQIARSDEDFAGFWEAYPNQVGEAAARRAFAKAARKVEAAVLLAAVERYRSTKPPDREWMNPSNWLNGERWLDRPAGLNGAGAPAAEPAPRRRPSGPPPARL